MTRCRVPPPGTPPPRYLMGPHAASPPTTLLTMDPPAPAQVRVGARANLLALFDLAALAALDLMLAIVTPAPRVVRTKRPASASPGDGDRPKRAKTGG
jgi:hypothetical protein